MNWQQQLTKELNAAAGETLLAVDTPAGSLRCALHAVDAIGCAFFELSLATDRFDACSVDQLKEVSERLSGKVNYLLEPVSPIEIDREGATVQMRSNPPQKDDDATTYYELLVRRSGLLLRRYRRAKGEAREQVAAFVTREVLLRLAADFVAAAG